MLALALNKKKLPSRQRWTLLKIDLLPPPCTLKWHLILIILSNFNSSRQTLWSVLKDAILHDRDGHCTCTLMFIQQCKSLPRNRCHCFLIMKNEWYQLVPEKQVNKQDSNRLAGISYQVVYVQVSQHPSPQIFNIELQCLFVFFCNDVSKQRDIGTVNMI